MLASRKIVGRGFSDWVPWKIGAEQHFGRDACFGQDTETLFLVGLLFLVKILKHFFWLGCLFFGRDTETLFWLGCFFWSGY